jgi:methyltransferase (TIGR00027 family)
MGGSGGIRQPKGILNLKPEAFMKQKITLDKEAETLLIPLYGRAMMSRAGKIIHDPFAEETLQKIDYDFSKLKVEEKIQVFMGIRGAIIDDFTKQFLEDNPESLVVYLGCGLDSRFFRVDNGKVRWYDLDFPQVTDIKGALFTQNERYSLIASSVTDDAWLEKIRKEDIGKPTLVIAEGLLMYLSEQEVQQLFKNIRDTFIKSMLIFDAYSSLTARHAMRPQSLKKTGASIRWGTDSHKEIEAFGAGITFLQKKYLTEYDMHSLSGYYRFMFRVAGRFKAAKEAHRIFVFELESKTNK